MGDCQPFVGSFIPSKSPAPSSKFVPVPPSPFRVALAHPTPHGRLAQSPASKGDTIRRLPLHPLATASGPLQNRGRLCHLRRLYLGRLGWENDGGVGSNERALRPLSLTLPIEHPFVEVCAMIEDVRHDRLTYF
jgi:hypothetical protein